MEQRTYEAPGPGTWELDTTHTQKPVTRYTAAALSGPLQRGFQYGTERYGLFLSYLQSAYINGFCYAKPVLAGVPEDAPPGPPPDGFFEQPELVARFENGPRAIEQKLWREDLKRWDEEVKPDSIRRHRVLQSVPVESLDDEELIQHLIDCRDNLAEMYFRHHEFTIPAIMPVGLYLDQVCRWIDISVGEALELLKGSSPASAGIAVAELEAIARALEQQGITADRFAGSTPADTLQALRSLPDPVGAAVEAYLDIVGYQLTSGYDISETYALENPEILVANIWRALERPHAGPDEAKLEARRQSIRDRIPAEHRSGFDSLLAEARLVNRLRDERGLYNEAKAFGLARRAVLEAGARLRQRGLLDDPELLVHASHDEMLALLRGRAGPGPDELSQREAWYRSVTIDDAPPYLGPPPDPPPPPEALPEIARRAEAAVGAVLGNVFAVASAEVPPDDVIEGFSVSPGVYEGTARIIQNPADFHRLQAGDVLVTRNTSAAFNVVLPLLGAIVTDRGGQLSHAAIVAREYGIPGIVGTRNATGAIADGARVRVDGGAGRVEVLS